MWRMSEGSYKHPDVGWVPVLNSCLWFAVSVYLFVDQGDNWFAVYDARQVSLDEV